MAFRVAVLLASFNGATWIREQIDSILSQVDVEISLFIGDDFSSDETLSIILNEYGEEKRISVVGEVGTRYGSPAANFLRLFAAVPLERYDYIFLADQDDYWYDKKVISAIKKMLEIGADCYAADLICLYSDGRRKLLRKSYAQTNNDYLFQGASAGCTYGLSSQAAGLCKRTFALMSEELKKIISHDWMIYAITRSNSCKWILDSEIYIDYRQHSANAYGALGLSSYKKRLRLLKSGWYRKNIIALSGFCHLTEDQLKIVSSLKSWNLKDRIFLISKSWSFRRRPVERFYMMMLIVFNLL